MTEQSSMHAYLNWTKQRIDEMDATLAALETKGSQLKAESQVKADQLVADQASRFPRHRSHAGRGLAKSGR